MNQAITELDINGVKYVPKDSVQNPLSEKNAVIVRCKSAGVFFGEMSSHDKVTGTAVLKNARRCWYWSGAASLSQLAVDGTSNPQECKFPVAVPEITVAEVLEVIPCTKKAVESLTNVKIWKA